MSWPQSSHPSASSLKGKEREQNRDARASALQYMAMATPAVNPPSREEMKEEIDKRERAARVLDSWELLAMYSKKYREVGCGSFSQHIGVCTAVENTLRAWYDGG